MMFKVFCKTRTAPLNLAAFSSFIEKMNSSLKNSVSQQKHSSTLLVERVLEKIDKQFYKPQHIEAIKKKVDLQQEMEALENQLKQQIAKSLKKTEEKLVGLLAVANAACAHLDHTGQKDKTLVKEYNELVKECQKARWELMIHRQSVGFTIRNHQLITTLYPLPARIPVQ